MATKNWRLAKSLMTLKAEVNARYPTRSKVSDGAIGDVDHSNRLSDHNPDSAGVVRAIDVTNWDPDGHIDADFSDDVSQVLAEFLRRTKPARVKYVIWRGRMFSAYATSAYPAWTWRPYSGENGHFHHVHVSVVPDARADSTAPWGFNRTLLSGEDDDMPTADEIADAVWNKKLTNKGGDAYPARDIVAAIDQHAGQARDGVDRLEDGQLTLTTIVRALPKAILAAAIPGVRTRRKGAEAYEDIDVARALARAAEAPVIYLRQDDAAAAATKETR